MTNKRFIHFSSRIASYGIFVFSLSLTTTAFGQYCNKTQIGQNIAPSNFDQSVSGLVFDKRTQLTWSRCFVGQQWDDTKQTCFGVPRRYSWQESLTLAKTQTVSNQTGWRLPNAKELTSIIDYQCMLPPLNPVLFPNAPASIDHGVWTSSPVFIYVNTNEIEKHIWSIDLYNGVFFQHGISIKNYLLLVK